MNILVTNCGVGVSQVVAGVGAVGVVEISGRMGHLKQSLLLEQIEGAMGVGKK